MYAQYDRRRVPYYLPVELGKERRKDVWLHVKLYMQRTRYPLLFDKGGHEGDESTAVSLLAVHAKVSPTDV